MIITDIWNLHYQSFIVQIKGETLEQIELEKVLKQKFPDKIFLIVRRDTEDGGC